jgi:hypothetical protein
MRAAVQQQFPLAYLDASNGAEGIMGTRDAIRRADTQGRESARRGLEQVTDPMHSASSVDDRVVTNPDPEEQEQDPKRPQTEPIVSINGEDVDSSTGEERQVPQRKRPAA